MGARAGLDILKESQVRCPCLESSHVHSDLHSLAQYLHQLCCKNVQFRFLCKFKLSVSLCFVLPLHMQISPGRCCWCLLPSYITGSGAIQHFVKWITRACFSDANLLVGNGESLHPSFAKFKTIWNCAYISLYALREKNFEFTSTVLIVKRRNMGRVK
jgi:hypothetical protein